MTTSSAPISLPPQETWVPGRLVGGEVLHDALDLHVVVAHGDVYPTGLLVQLEARFRELLTREAMHEVGRQARAFHHDPVNHDGPHLRRLRGDGGEAVGGMPWAHAGSTRFWRFGFWMPFDDGEIAGGARSGAAWRARFDWPAQGVRAEWALPWARIVDGVAAARQLWDDGPGLERRLVGVI